MQEASLNQRAILAPAGCADGISRELALSRVLPKHGGRQTQTLLFPPNPDEPATEGLGIAELLFVGRAEEFTSLTPQLYEFITFNLGLLSNLTARLSYGPHFDEGVMRLVEMSYLEQHHWEDIL